jgi:hypothetical protein
MHAPRCACAYLIDADANGLGRFDKLSDEDGIQEACAFLVKAVCYGFQFCL